MEIYRNPTTSISNLISVSTNLEPTFYKPAFSSSYVTLPSLSVSIKVNISLIIFTSSMDKCSTIFKETHITNVSTSLLLQKKKTALNSTITHQPQEMLTWRALFLNLFITENCLSLVLTIFPNGTIPIE
jgi:hypothetical protein